MIFFLLYRPSFALHTLDKLRYPSGRSAVSPGANPMSPVECQGAVDRAVRVLSSDGLRAFTVGNSTGSCPDCQFGPMLLKEKSWLNSEPSPQKGDWRKAILLRPGGVGKPLQERNVNEFLRLTPTAVIPKGTEFFHVSKEADWFMKSMVGGSMADGYSFFTLRERGFAAAHASGDMKARIQLRTSTDIHCFFIKEYAYKCYRLKTEFGRLEIDCSEPHVGGELVSMIDSTWPVTYRPAIWASCSECEIAIHNSYIRNVLQTTAIATSTDSFATNRSIVPTGDLPSNPAGPPPLQFEVPGWMGPNGNSNRSTVKEILSLKRRIGYWNELSAQNSPYLRLFGL